MRLLLAAGASPVLPPEQTNISHQPVCGAYAKNNIELMQLLCESGGLQGIEEAVRAECIENEQRLLEKLRCEYDSSVPDSMWNGKMRACLLRYLPEK